MKLLVSLTILGCLVRNLRADVSELKNIDRHYLPPDNSQELAGSSSVQSLNISPGLGQYNHNQKHDRGQKHDQHQKYDFKHKNDQHQHQRKKDHHLKDDRQQKEDHQQKHDHQKYYDHQKNHDHRQHNDHQRYNDNQKYNDHQKKDHHRQQHDDNNDHKSETKVGNNIRLSLPKALSAAPNVARSNLEILFDDSQVENAPKKALFTPTGNGKGASAAYSSYSNSKASKKSQHNTITKATKDHSGFLQSSSDRSSNTSSRNEQGKLGISKINGRNDNISNKNTNISKTKPASFRLTSTPTIGTKRQQIQSTPKRSEYQRLSSSSESRLRNRDHEFTSSGAQAPEVIYKPGDEINFNHVSLYDNLNKDESVHSATGIDTVKLADGYHYAAPRKGFLN